MNEEERRQEILKAEAAIHGLAQRMAEASERTEQADAARRTLESAVGLIEELNAGLQTLMESEKKAAEERSESWKQARESLAVGAQELQKAQEVLDKRTDHLETSIDERSHELHGLLDAKLCILSQDINVAQEHLSAKADHLETSFIQRSQELQGSFDTKLDNLLLNINTISNKLLFVMDQNEASNRRILALDKIISELSEKFQNPADSAINNSEDIEDLKTQVNDLNKQISTIGQASAAKKSHLSHRLRSAIIGGLGVVMVFMFIRLV